MKRVGTFFIGFLFLFQCILPPQGLAQTLDAMRLMPSPGTAVMLTPAFTPAHLTGMVIDARDPFKFDFIVHRGGPKLALAEKQAEYSRLIKYFLAAMAIPDTEQWVNLSPYEKDRIIPDNFGLTGMGRDLLAQDYLLKQLSASLSSPDSAIGKKFWEQVYAKAFERFGTTEVPTDVISKVWIVPGRASIYEKADTVYVVEQHLKVMTEQDYLAMQKHAEEGGNVSVAAGDVQPAALLVQDVMREVVIPAIEKEVNEGSNFAPLRQVYSSMILAAWYKYTLKDSILNKVYGDRSLVKGIDQDPATNQTIYDQYVTAFRKGVFNMIKEDVDAFSQEVIPRKYFSGGMKAITGVDFAMGGSITRLSTLQAPINELDKVQVAFKDAAQDQFGEKNKVGNIVRFPTIQKRSRIPESLQGLDGVKEVEEMGRLYFMYYKDGSVKVFADDIKKGMIVVAEAEKNSILDNWEESIQAGKILWVTLGLEISKGDCFWRLGSGIYMVAFDDNVSIWQMTLNHKWVQKYTIKDPDWRESAQGLTVAQKMSAFRQNTGVIGIVEKTKDQKSFKLKKAIYWAKQLGLLELITLTLERAREAIVTTGLSKF